MLSARATQAVPHSTITASTAISAILFIIFILKLNSSLPALFHSVGSVSGVPTARQRDDYSTAGVL